MVRKDRLIQILAPGPNLYDKKKKAKIVRLAKITWYSYMLSTGDVLNVPQYKLIESKNMKIDISW